MSIAALVESVKDAPLELGVLSRDEKATKALQMRLEGIPVEAVAAKFGVTPGTVRTWINHKYKEYRESFETVTGADIIAEQLHVLEHLEDLCFHEITQADADSKTMDIEAGRVVKKQQMNTKETKLNYINTAMRVRKMKIDLLTQTGVIPKEPDRIYASLEDDRKAKTKEEEDKSMKRSPEEISRNIIKLLESTKEIG